MVWLKHQPVGVYQVYSELLVTIAPELMPPFRPVDRNHRESRSGIQNGEPACDHPCHPDTVRPLNQFHRVEGPSEFLSPKDDFHSVTCLRYLKGNENNSPCQRML